jgi:hypothetical protein
MTTGVAADGRARRDRGGERTLRDALRGHPAGPEVVAALGPPAERPPPVGWDRWAPAARERYLDAALDQARGGAGPPPDQQGRTSTLHQPTRYPRR